MRYSCASVLLVSLLISSASAVTMAWTPIGDPGNTCDPDLNGGTFCRGGVRYSYSIGTYDVTNAQYAEFLNAKAKSDPLGLYDVSMGNPEALGGITRSGVSGSYTYSAVAGREKMPANLVDFFDALRFANWMNNGQGNADTETGAYTLLGGTPVPSNIQVTRNAGATIALTSEDEWYKAAYYNAPTTSYFAYPTGSDTPPTCSTPTGDPNHANCGLAMGLPYGDLTPVDSYPGSASPYGTFDQGGNVMQWMEPRPGYNPGLIRGGSFGAPATTANASESYVREPGPAGTSDDQGFRLTMLPEPSVRVLVFAGLLGLAGWRKQRD